MALPKPPTQPVYQDVLLETLFGQVLGALDPKPNREGLQDTPKRVCKAWRFWTQGYAQDKDVAAAFKTFADGAERYDEMIWETPIPFYSTCEHHLAPFFGTATIAYIPNGRVVGLSKLSRVLDIYSRRLQVQERITQQMADAMQEHLKPKGVGVFLTARHMCMESRGICKQGISTHTCALRGVIKKDAKARAEFMALVSTKT